MEGGAGPKTMKGEEEDTEETTSAAAVFVVVVPFEAEADAVNANDVDNVDVPLPYFVQLSTSGRMTTSRRGVAVRATTAVVGGGGVYI